MSKGNENYLLEDFEKLSAELLDALFPTCEAQRRKYKDEYAKASCCNGRAGIHTNFSGAAQAQIDFTLNPFNLCAHRSGHTCTSIAPIGLNLTL